VIYLDSSVLLAAVFREPRSPRAGLWDEALTSSRLLTYEVWIRLNAYGLAASHGELASARLDRVDFVELSERVLGRALLPYPVPVRTLDGLHLATAAYLREQGEAVELASYDHRLVAGARALGIPLAAL
jgi:predicted nucleic acid-binding protein